MTGMLEWTSVVNTSDATNAVALATGGIKTMIATILALTGLFITLFFWNRIIGLIKSALKG